MSHPSTCSGTRRAHAAGGGEPNRARRSVLGRALLVGLAGACGRVEEPRATADPPPTSQPARAASLPKTERGASPTPAPARCIAPWPGTPPATAHAAELCPPDPKPAPKLATGRVTFTDAPNQPMVTVELAERPGDRSRGLMYRTKLEPDRGMLFSWNDEQPRSFWMHNTCIPLDMLFIAADATIVGILEQVPTLNDEARGVECPSAHVLELDAGWSRSHGVRPGQKLRITR